MPKEKSAGAVIYRKENSEIYYLLLHYAGMSSKSKGYWDLPKGHLEGEETEMEAAYREIEEETGIKGISFEPEFRLPIRYFFRSKGRTIFKTVVFFLAGTKQKEVAISDEHIGYDWLPFDEAFSKMKFANAKNVLSKAKDYLIKNKYA